MNFSLFRNRLPERMLPDKLHCGDKIALIAPSSPVPEHILDIALDSIRYLNLKPEIYPSCLDLFPWKMAGNEINNAFLDNSIKGIFCIRGGYGAAKTVQNVDFDIIRYNPKFFCGSSDVTLLLNSIYRNTGLITYHSPMPSSGYGKLKPGLTLDALGNAVFRHDMLCISCNLLKWDYDDYLHRNPDCVSGHILGGNLTVMNTMLGTPLMPDLSGNIMFLEDVNEPVYNVDRMLMHLRYSGVLDNSKALILGHFNIENKTAEYNTDYYNDVKSAAFDIFETTDLKILCDFPAGHISPSAAFPVGGNGTVRDNGIVEISL